MPFHPDRIFAPSDDDCFFHVVAFFQGADIDDWRAAKCVREAIARGLAQVFLPDPWNDLDKLTAARFYGLVPPNTADPALMPQHELGEAGTRILKAYQRAMTAHPREYPQDIIDYIVWVQFSAEELRSCRWFYREARLALPQHAIRGDEDMAVACVEEILCRPVKLYALADDVQCSRIEDVISLAWDEAHGADRNSGFGIVNLLNVAQGRWDAVFFREVHERSHPSKLTKVAWMRDNDTSWGTLAKLVNLPRASEWQMRAGAASLDELGAQTRLKLFFDDASDEARTIRISLDVVLMPYENDAGQAVGRLPSFSEYARNPRYGWRAICDKEILGRESSEGHLRRAGLSGAVPLDSEIEVMVPGDREVEVSIFLPPSGGVRYTAVVVDAHGTMRETPSAVETHRMLFYNLLVTETLTVQQQADVSRALVQVEAVMLGLYVHLRPIPLPSKLKTSVVHDAEDGGFSLMGELRDAAVRAADYHPYFFNLAVVESFSAHDLRDFAATVGLESLIRENSACVQTDAISKGVPYPLRSAYVSLGRNGNRHSVNAVLDCQLDERQVRVTVPTELMDLFARQQAERRRRTERKIRKADRKLDAWIWRQPPFQQSLACIRSSRSRSPEEERKLWSQWRKDNFKQRLEVGRTAEPEVTVGIVKLAVARPCRIGGYRSEWTKSCVIPVSEPLQRFADTVLHEVGHVVGLAPHPDSPQGFDLSPYFYGKHDNYESSHCQFGVPTDTSDPDDDIRICIMFGSTYRTFDAHFCPYCSGAILRGDYVRGFVAKGFCEDSREALQDRSAEKEIEDAAFEVAKVASQRWLALRDEWAHSLRESVINGRNTTGEVEQDAVWNAGGPDICAPIDAASDDAC